MAVELSSSAGWRDRWERTLLDIFLIIVFALTLGRMVLDEVGRLHSAVEQILAPNTVLDPGNLNRSPKMLDHDSESLRSPDLSIGGEHLYRISTPEHGRGANTPVKPFSGVAR